ncbi:MULTISPECIES: phosphatase PAP2 family protein [unclassified Streptomyces]|uniref:phosphatase PAP2 family protein n=1 Tax=unclassified Streptomyces TaxID=2593676 RepID=UPI001F035618|nr:MULTISPECIES: phosphatase PAP2 family protein [unclassified Streptomyces]MCH0562404.1 phosphatase PAP2 family protein [Streptomyces sp. MUM 2J]MCH0570508.1 phosphatase PAP2 family protein [Streptomyces sp. MUM 136J]
MDAPPAAPPAAPPPHRGEGRRTALGAGIAPFLGAGMLTSLVALGWRPLIETDTRVARTTHRWATDDPGLTHAVRILTDWVWDPWTMRLAATLAAVWLVWRYAAWLTAVWLVVTCDLAILAEQGLKAAVGRPRPTWPDPVDSARYAAFPSGHAMTATVVCGLLLWLVHRYGAGRRVRRTAFAVAAVSVVGVGATRVWLGVHWLSDVVGGWLLGALVVALAVAVHPRRA